MPGSNCRAYVSRMRTCGMETIPCGTGQIAANGEQKRRRQLRYAARLYRARRGLGDFGLLRVSLREKVAARKGSGATGMNWRIYRLPGSREIWHIDSGPGTQVFNVRGYQAHA